MAGITLSQARTKLQTWMDAEEAVAAGQQYQIEGRALTRANLAEIASRIEYWNKKVQSLSSCGLAINTGIPKRVY